MKIKLLSILTLMLISAQVCFSQNADDEKTALVSRFIEWVKNNELEKITEKVRYPLNRTAPIPPIKDKKEFIKRFSNIVDDSLRNIILQSDPKEDWSQVGWRGIMLGRGGIWLDLSGNIIAINYQSAFEINQAKELIASQKKVLHPSIQKFIQPRLMLTTSKFQIRIDELEDGTLRYASWSLNQPMSDKPDLILFNGRQIFDGSGGNNYYEFKNDIYSYQCWHNVIGKTPGPTYQLEVLKDEKVVLSQPAEKMEY